jgi:hypothetical protein
MNQEDESRRWIKKINMKMNEFGEDEDEDEDAIKQQN